MKMMKTIKSSIRIIRNHYVCYCLFRLMYATLYPHVIAMRLTHAPADFKKHMPRFCMEIQLEYSPRGISDAMRRIQSR
jgi:hypothetical protein